MDRLLDDAKRMVLAWAGPRTGQPLLTPMAFWWDGRNLWSSTAADSAKTRGLEADGECACYVPPLPRTDDVGLLLRGTARVFRATDLVAMATHGAVIAAAQTALAVKNYSSVAGYVVDASRVPSRWLPQNRVMIRIAVDAADPIEQPDVPTGIAPGLPPAIPPEVRRLLAGSRRIVLATTALGGIGLLPAVWGAGMSVELPTAVSLPDDVPVGVVVDHDPGFRPTEVAGVMLHGTLGHGRIVPDSVRWWQGFGGGSAAIESRLVDPIVIPD